MELTVTSYLILYCTILLNDFLFCILQSVTIQPFGYNATEKLKFNYSEWNVPVTVSVNHNESHNTECYKNALVKPSIFTVP